MEPCHSWILLVTHLVTPCVLPSGHTSQLDPYGQRDDHPPAPEPASPWAGGGEGIQHWRQTLYSSNRPDSPYPGRGNFHQAAAFREPYPPFPPQYGLPDALASPLHPSADPASFAQHEGSPPYSYEGFPHRVSGSPAHYPTSPAHSGVVLTVKPRL